MKKVIVFLICLTVAILILKFRYQVKEFIGNVSWAERYLGMGGTHNLIILIALAVFIGGLLYATGTFQGFIQNTVGRIF